MNNNNLMINRNISLLLILDKLKERADYEADDIIDYYYPVSFKEEETIETNYRLFYPGQSIKDDRGILIAGFLELIACKIEQEYEINELEFNICKNIFEWEGTYYENLKTKKIK
jgi:hypothetical protein